ncbi:MAG: T9SS type A sorting domain-containing protein [candidate division Zixibacteria bacterium]|nr:T9SS type A sorting domain-containing protein [candidate division Zixibacteria bacterium]
MRNSVGITGTLVILLYFASMATIINIPDDYPTIQQGINAGTDGDTVLVQSGTYVENISFNGHNIVLGSLFLTTGDTSYISTTIIDGDSSGTVVSFLNGENNGAVIAGFLIRNGYSVEFGGGVSCANSNPTITCNIISGNIALGSQFTDATGGGIYCHNSSPIISYNIITTNLALSGWWASGAGGGIYCFNSSPTISNNVISENIALGEWGYGGGISMLFSSPLLINNLIIENQALQMGGGIYCWSSNPIIANNIIWADSADDRTEVWSDTSSALTITYCDIQDTLWPGVGNISTDPLFRDPDNGDFHLQSMTNPDCGDAGDSPCIDAGNPTIFDSMLDCDWGLGEERSDMGVYGGLGFPTSVEDEDIAAIPLKFILSQNYPNPFNASTTIEYSLPQPADVQITIYNILGQEIANLVDSRLPAGNHKVNWDAGDLPSGMYFYHIQAGDYSQSIKMTFLK